MHKSNFLLILSILSFSASTSLYAQKLENVDISKVTTTINRTISMNVVEKTHILSVNPGPGGGMIMIKYPTFENGEIQFEVKGQDVYQKSFVGFAFHIKNEKNYEAIYFRPFNFRTTDELRKKHAVQYVSLPNYDWEVLRDHHPLEYEQPIGENLDPNDWFKVRIKVEGGKISVFTNDQTRPCLEVTSLGDLKSGKIGFFTGDDSPGIFRNLKISRK
ncbi:hypothetical protein DBR11_17150 [Pedobacter sp. HMWF019]|uniref:family 16 glycoside hydrolase n=1 Tax=Pedobacter sp. HMWF019 TaxID=2056856 RepID=UPI000D380CBA|nr:family 16 glycoside hydrolase [Pedobacter sp. HMWF019]PTS97432.1 hypothetical protein DBR11_17150 [Pedobacter sp. HMWF019]